MRDWRGVLVEKGSTIVYPQRRSSSLWMVEATVIAVTEREKDGRTVPALKVLPITTTWTHYNVEQREVTLTALDRVSVVQPRKDDRAIAEVMHRYCPICNNRHEDDQGCE